MIGGAGDRALDGQVGRVQEDVAPRARQPDRDPDVPAEPAGLEIGLEVEVVVGRSDVGRKTEA